MAAMLGFLALLAVPTEAGAHISVGGSDADADARLQTLRENVKKAMLELYMENAHVHVDDKLALVAGHSAAGKQTVAGAPAAELTEASIDESNRMIDQIERAVVSETKRSMFRALTRLRGATIASYDGMANAQSANIDAFSKKKKWTKTHDINHLAEQEGNVEKWAFPNSDPNLVGAGAEEEEAAAAPAPAAAATPA